MENAVVVDIMAENICSLLPVDLKNEPYEEYEESTRQQLSDDIDNASARVESVADELTNDVCDIIFEI